MQCACAILYCNLWPFGLYHIFPLYFINGMIFEKKVRNIKLYFDVLQNICLKHLIIRRIHQDVITNVSGRHVKYPLFLSFLMKLEFSQQFFKQYSNIKFHENPSSESRVFPCGRTDGRTDRQTDGWMEKYTDVTKLIVAFCNFANASKNYRLLANADRRVAVDCVTVLCFTFDCKLILV